MMATSLPTQEQLERQVLSFRREPVGPGVLLAHIAISEGQSSSLHRHTRTTDTFYVMGGELTVTVHVAPDRVADSYRTLCSTPPAVRKLDDTREAHDLRLLPGEVATVLAGVAHSTTNRGREPCRFLCIEGVGPYDFLPLAE
jgi:quercetin dioxygenase-like cupin family protein